VLTLSTLFVTIEESRKTNEAKQMTNFFVETISSKSFAVMNGEGRGHCLGVYKTKRSAQKGLDWAIANPSLAAYYAGDSVNAAQYDIATSKNKVVALV
jgi:hypothetical protein